MDIVKCYAWEKSVKAKVLNVQDDEISWFSKAQLLAAVNTSFANAVPVLVTVVAFGSYTMLGGILTLAKAFTSLSLFVALRFSLTMFPTLVTAAVNANVSLKRLQELLLAEEHMLQENSPLESGVPAILIKNGTFSWEPNAGHPTLSNINLEIEVGSLVAIVGSTGEGKTSIVSAFLGEIPAIFGSQTTLRGTEAYVPQVSWFFNATVQDNIIFGSSYDPEQYNRAIQASALRQDLTLFPSRDLTEIGERGVNISGEVKEHGTYDELLINGPLFKELLEKAGMAENTVSDDADARAEDAVDGAPNRDMEIELAPSLKLRLSSKNDAKEKVKEKSAKALLIKEEERETGLISGKVLSREVKHLDSITQSPVYAQFAEALNGLAIIWAYKVYDWIARMNGNTMDTNSCFTLVNISSYRWLSMRLEFLGALMIWIVGMLAVLGNAQASDPAAFAPLMGLLLSYAFSIAQLMTNALHLASTIENSFNAVDRVGNYTDVTPEASLVIEDERPPPGWPSAGVIEFKNVVMRYTPELPPVLHGVSVKIRSIEKVGIVGRTGAGKSSMLNTLFWIVEVEQGHILIDGLDIEGMGLSGLCGNLGIIPQNPVLFPAIEFGMSLVAEIKGFVLDEATAAVDVGTDALIQKTVHEQFKPYTMLTIAHWLNTTMDSDHILVLDAGQVIEMDTPQKLLLKQDGIFSSMVQSTGAANSQYLYQIVMSNFDAEIEKEVPNGHISHQENMASDDSHDHEQKVARKGWMIHETAQ
ncbi:unnamed protein product [Sphagnum jensenii]|uniref:Uncharacterized protein n=1 Tax=Sphagnum jensenii TaxID=128206 RepID=A0ABP1AUJ8_9BRYO